jgi:uncharacterized protein YodC (DUF2158 family)
MQPKFDIGHSVKRINEEQEMMIITVISDGDYLSNLVCLPAKFNGKYKCAWIKEDKVMLKIYHESELTAV